MACAALLSGNFVHSYGAQLLPSAPGLTSWNSDSLGRCIERVALRVMFRLSWRQGSLGGNRMLHVTLGLGLLLSAALVEAAPLQVPTPAALRSQLESLKPGQFLWYPQVSPVGPVTVVVSLTEQRVYVYRNGIAIGVSTVSSGKAGRETPTGVFSILQKKVEHKSSLYNSAPMPTWSA